MSVIVRMEMPKDCYDCPMYDFAVYRGKSTLCCNAHFDLKLIPNNGNPRPSWCPIVGVLPKQHGDLINREYAIASTCSGLTRTIQTTEGAEKWIRVREVRESIKSAPIIVPAERSET